nr:chitobiase/beta-hexosaminidase C-terminal domain-containing protein [Neiella litorisoli]
MTTMDGGQQSAISHQLADGKLHAYVPFPDVAIEYRQLGGKWQQYQHPIPDNATTELRSRSVSGERFSRISRYQNNR